MNDKDGQRMSGLPFDPSNRECDFCDEPATDGVEIPSRDGLGIGQFVYACESHIAKAEQSVNGRRSTLRKKRRQDSQLFDPSLPR